MGLAVAMQKERRRSFFPLSLTFRSRSPSAVGRTVTSIRAPVPRCGAALTRHPGRAAAPRTKRAVQEAGASAEEVASFMREATAGDYDHLLATVVRWADAE